MTAEQSWSAMAARQLIAEHRARQAQQPPPFNPEDYAILARDLEWMDDARPSEDRGWKNWALLQSLFEHQLRQGCDDSQCSQPTCLTFRLRTRAKPLRQLTQVSISATATMLAGQPEAARQLCARTRPALDTRPTADPLPEKPLDDSSFTQAVLATGQMRASMMLLDLSNNCEGEDLGTQRLTHRVPVLSKLEHYTLHFLMRLIDAPESQAAGHSFQIRAFLRRSCEHVLTNPAKIHASLLESGQELIDLVDDNFQRRPIETEFLKAVKIKLENISNDRRALLPKVAIASATEFLNKSYHGQHLDWILRAAERAGCSSVKQNMDQNGAICLSILKMACHALKAYTEELHPSRSLTACKGKFRSGLAQIHHSTALQLAQLIANQLAPFHTSQVLGRTEAARLEQVHNNIRTELLDFVARTSFVEQKLGDIGSSDLFLCDLIRPLLLWLGVLCDMDARGTCTIRNGSACDKLLSAFDKLYGLLSFSSRHGILLRNPESRTDMLIYLLPDFGGSCNPEELARTWINPQPGYKSLLDYPFLFLGPEKSRRTRTLVLAFRRICFVRMMKVYKSASLNNTKIILGFSYPIHADLDQARAQSSSLSMNSHPRGLRPAVTPQLEIMVSRHQILDDALDQVWKREKRHLLAPIKVKFSDAGEIAADLGGVAQEFFRLVADKMQSPDVGLFTLTGPKQYAWFNPGCLEPTYRYCLLGMLVALAVHNGFTLPVSFPILLYRRLIDPSALVTRINDIKDGWPELVMGFRNLLEYDGNVEEDIGVDYTFPLSHPGGVISLTMNEKNVAAWSNAEFRGDFNLISMANETAVPVTNHNRKAYVQDYIHFLTTVMVQHQFAAFAQGFYSILDQHILATLTPQALRVLVEGHQNIDPKELASATQYVQYSREDTVIKNFWTYVSHLSPERLKKLLEFVTATDRIPVNGLRSLGFTLQRHGEDDDHLPSASTCFGILLLPAYSSVEVLTAKMDLALDNTEGFGLR
ncbi:hypothetical protein FH972_023396 [Carpinus fangiana]|uniref:HECT-type E3 ubiquitin transferase n=1 Tax=Carpinus fangiana TaxID=176857 RepID=A0A5N6KVB3_9ROSI|nr:hypothetical protein FH972_023396 [Carpinus fangiana]